ncbi:MAG: hypothetical protein WD096_10500 [Actinomycetota bacterium]
MPDAKEHLRRLDLVDAPDVWADARTREPSRSPEIHEGTPTGQRLIAIVVAFGLFGGVVFLGVRALERGPDVDVGTSPSPSVSVRAQPTGTWLAMPEPPIDYRYGASGFWVGDRVVIIGGSEQPPGCEPDAHCVAGGVAPFDGAAFDPPTDTWTTIADAPMPVVSYTGAVLDDTLYVWGSPDLETYSLLAYHPLDDRWDVVDLPPEVRSSAGLMRLAPADDAIVMYLDSQEREPFSPDYLFEPANGELRQLTPDPLMPTFDRSIVWTGSELILLGIEVGLRAEGEEYLYRAATFDPTEGRWRALPDTGIAGYDPSWFWSAGGLVNPSIGHVGDNGSEQGTGPPYGGALDPSTGVWEELPSPPDRHAYAGPAVGGGRYVVSSQGAILDALDGSWEALAPLPVVPDEGAVAVWAGDRLVVWGGLRWKKIDGVMAVDGPAKVVESGWSWIPRSG